MSLLTEKQELVLRQINQFGVLAVTQLTALLSDKCSHVTVYNSKQKLVRLGLVAEEKIGYQSVVSVRPSGVDYLGSSLTAFTKINYTMLKHQLLSVDVILALIALEKKRGGEFSFITERELRSDYLDANFNLEQRRNTKLLKTVPDRIPDFVFVSGGKRIAYEVELTQKTGKRYQEKLQRYQDEILNAEYAAVRYLCETDRIRETVITNAAAVQFPKEFLQVELIGRLLEIAKA